MKLTRKLLLILFFLILMLLLISCEKEIWVCPEDTFENEVVLSLNETDFIFENFTTTYPNNDCDAIAIGDTYLLIRNVSDNSIYYNFEVYLNDNFYEGVVDLGPRESVDFGQLDFHAWGIKIENISIF